MAQEARRAKIVDLLAQAKAPLTGAQLSSLLGVTRQIIVGDVAVLRARGEQIIATPQGYLIYQLPQANVFRSKVAVRHSSDPSSMAHELRLIVELGGAILDVTVEHPLYGELTANLQIHTKADVEQFVAKMKGLQAEPLSILTDGYHLHSIEAPTRDVMGAILSALRDAGFLAE